MKTNIMRDTWAIKSIDSNWVKNVHRCRARKSELIEVEWVIFHYMNKSSSEALHVI